MMHLRFAMVLLRVSSKRSIPLKPCVAAPRLVLVFAMSRWHGGRWRGSATSWGRSVWTEPAPPLGERLWDRMEHESRGQTRDQWRQSWKQARGQTRASGSSSAGAAGSTRDDSGDERTVFSGETREDMWAWTKPDASGC